MYNKLNRKISKNSRLTDYYDTGGTQPDDQLDPDDSKSYHKNETNMNRKFSNKQLTSGHPSEQELSPIKNLSPKVDIPQEPLGKKRRSTKKRKNGRISPSLIDRTLEGGPTEEELAEALARHQMEEQKKRFKDMFRSGIKN